MKKLIEEQLPDIKLIIIDIDGTLLNPEGVITPRTKAAVQAAQEAGIVVSLATARRYTNTAGIATELGLTNPLILYDGSMVVMHPQGTLLHAQTMRPALAQQAVKLLLSQHIQPVIHPLQEMVEEIWTGPAESDGCWVAPYFMAYPEQVRRLPYDALYNEQAAPLRIVGFAAREELLPLLPALASLDCSWNLIERGNYGCAELAIMEAGCSKASGMLTLARLLRIPLYQVMAIGDNNNDIEMLRAAGWGVAMGQASTPVKAAARAVTATNAEDGAALAIERYVLSRCAATAASNSLRRAT
ncbi:MAG TPA: Cof-type HAD-IIB family hydrolase [Ktedonobacteraceae bacterium]|nr:Cof-type HAD-IIB family hydrolase [Ktedonobacteraceae bacterium]